MQEWGEPFGASQAQVQLTFSGFVVAFASWCMARSRTAMAAKACW